MMPDDETMDRLARIGAAMPDAADFRPYAPERCPECGDAVWIAPYVDWTARIYCIGCGWGYTVEEERP